MRYLLLCPLLVSCAFAADKSTSNKTTANTANQSKEAKRVIYKPVLPPLLPQKAPPGVQVPPLPRIMVPREAKNMAYRKWVKADYIPQHGALSQITDGQKDTWITLPKGLHWVQIDLTVPCQIYAIHLWHGFEAPYVYRDIVIQISSDKDFHQGVVTVFNNSRNKNSRFGLGPDKPYVESRNGLLIDTGAPGNSGVLGRYVRFWSNGNQIDNLNRYMEIAVIGTTDYEEVKFALPPAKYQ